MVVCTFSVYLLPSNTLIEIEDMDYFKMEITLNGAAQSHTVYFRGAMLVFLGSLSGTLGSHLSQPSLISVRRIESQALLLEPTQSSP